MSFIVDAARRRQLNEEPSEAASWAYAQMQSRQRRLWIIVGLLSVVALLMGGALVIRWLIPADPVGHVGASEEITSVPDVQPASKPSDPIVELSSSPDNIPFYQPIETPLAEAEVVRIPVGISEAPPELQRELRQFIYSSHLYSDDPASRSLSVNGKRLREGDSLGHWTINNITENGAVWDNGALLIDINVLAQWQ